MSDYAKPQPFEYLLNAMEHAAQDDKPAERGYAAKRKAVFDHVAALLAERDAFRTKLCELAGKHLAETAALRTALRKYATHLHGCTACNRDPKTASCSCGLSALLLSAEKQ